MAHGSGWYLCMNNYRQHLREPVNSHCITIWTMVHASISKPIFHLLTDSIVRSEFQGHPDPPRRKATPKFHRTIQASNPHLRFQAEREAQKIVQKGIPSLVNLWAHSNPFLKLENVCAYHNLLTHIYRSYGPKPIYTDRTKRVKDARSEAQKEIEEYRKIKDEEFKKYEKEVYANTPRRDTQELI